MKRIATPLLLPFALLLFSFPLAAQESPAGASSVRIEPFQAEGGTEVGAQLAATVEQTIRLSLRLLQGITVLPASSGERETVEIEGVVRVEGGEYTIDVTLRDRRIPGEPQELIVATRSVLEVFDLADQLTEEAVRQISRRDIAFGSLALRPSGRGAWQVELGGERFEESPRTFSRLPAGTYTIRVYQEQATELVTVLEEEIVIEAGGRTQIAFDLEDPAEIFSRVIPRAETDYIQAIIYGTATPLSAVLDRAEAAAEQAGVLPLYGPRIEAWRPENTAETAGTAVTVNEAQARFSSFLQSELPGDPNPAPEIARIISVFEAQMSDWTEELAPSE